MGFSDNGESPLTDPDQPCSSSYELTPINVSTEVEPPINISGTFASVLIIDILPSHLFPAISLSPTIKYIDDKW